MKKLLSLIMALSLLLSAVPVMAMATEQPPADSLPKAAAPADLIWGVNHYFRDPATAQQTVRNSPGMMSCKPDPQFRGLIYFTVYQVAETGDGSASYYGTAIASYNGQGEWADADLTLNKDFESGTYFFTVQAKGDGVQYGDSELVFSDSWTYVKPNDQLPVSTNHSWEKLPDGYPNANVDFAATYYCPVEFSLAEKVRLSYYFAKTLDEEPLNIGTSTTSVLAEKQIGMLPASWLQRYGEGYYYFAVQFLSKDINQCANSPRSELSQPIYFTKDGVGTIPAPSDLPFTDVPGNSPYVDAVKWALEKNVTTGTSATTFSPEGTTTRGQVATFLWRAVDRPAAGVETGFADVMSGDYYAEPIAWAVREGITTGASATEFRPEGLCTVGHVLTFLWRTMGKPEPGKTYSFTDVNPEDYYAKAVFWAVENGIAEAKSGNYFGVDEPCPRGWVVTYLYRCLVK